MEEIQSEGAYPTSDNFNNLHWLRKEGKLPIPHREHNPYVDAFWKWFPDLYKTLQVFRITGGEPLLTKDTFKVLDYINNNPRPELELAINSNGCVPDKLFDQYIEKMKRITLDNKIGLTRLYTSVDTFGAQAEYIRDGLDFNQWYDNICRVLTELPKTKVTIMCTTGLLSLPNFHKLVDMIHPLKREFYSDERRVPITLDTAILRHPSYLSGVVADPSYAEMLEPALAVMNANAETHDNAYKGFFDFEIAKLKRFQQYIAAGPNPQEKLNIQQVRRDFASYVDEYDRRRNKDFLKTFPELEDFYNLCK
jgi:organic radical activating enzyme